MTGSRVRLRALGLAMLVGMLAGALPIHGAPPTGAADHPTVLLGEAPGTSALPAPAAAERLEVGGGPDRQASGHARRPPATARARAPSGAARRTAHLPSGAGLLGLLATPANAPPGA